MSLSEKELRELDLLEVESQEAAEDFRTALHEKIK